MNVLLETAFIATRKLEPVSVTVTAFPLNSKFLRVLPERRLMSFGPSVGMVMRGCFVLIRLVRVVKISLSLFNEAAISYRLSSEDGAFDTGLLVAFCIRAST